MSSRLIFFLTLLFAAVVTLVVINNQTPHLKPEPSKNQYPEYIAVEPVTVQYNNSGAINHHFRGRLFTHYLEAGITEVLNPEIVLYRDSEEPWQLTADKGTIQDNGKTVLLQGNVQLWQKEGISRKTELTTETLTLKPASKYVETDKPVMIKTTYNQTRATGMRAWLDKEFIELISKVSGNHEFNQ